MSQISQISKQFHQALSLSQDQYQEMYTRRVEATQDFYNQFFHRLVHNYGNRFQDERFRDRIRERIEEVLRTDNLQFIAVDGTCNRDVFSDWVTFFGGAYGARGELKLGGSQNKITYKRWSLENDVSMVAWVPVPFARLGEVVEEGEQFIVTEEEKINLSSVHVQIMQLSEIFLAYNAIRSSRVDAPHILMMDLSPSSVLASVARTQDNIGLMGYPHTHRILNRADISVAMAHPFSSYFGIPSTKNMDLYRVLVAELHQNPENPLHLASISGKLGIKEYSLKNAAEHLVKNGVLQRSSDGRTYHAAIRVDQSWSFVREFFQDICERLFINKDPKALQYDIKGDDSTVIRRWMSPNDLGFLIGVGMRLLIEECWNRRVLFYGIVKDSSSRYLTQNYLGVGLETGFYPELNKLMIGMLPWTDRIFCELLPLIDDNLLAPWCTVEFDSAFMTLHRERKEDNSTQVAGVMGRIVNQEKLFMKSLGQFF